MQVDDEKVTFNVYESMIFSREDAFRGQKCVFGEEDAKEFNSNKQPLCDFLEIKYS